MPFLILKLCSNIFTSSLILIIAGRKWPSLEGHNFSFGDTISPNSYDYTSVLFDLLKTLGAIDNNTTNVSIDSESFRGGTTIIPFLYEIEPLTSGYTSFDSAPGILSLTLRFKEQTTTPLSVFCFQLVNTNIYFRKNGTIVGA